VVIGYDYRKMIPYDYGNSNGKMKSDVYIQILSELLPDLQGIILYQDKDSAYNSKAITNWAKKNGLDLLILPGKSPDFSIIESIANPVKKLFHSRHIAS
jgi:transposase InsO family protein